MRIVNTTGNAHDTHIFDEDGKDVTRQLRVRKVTIEAGDRNRVILECDDVEIDMVGDQA